jgi:glycolate oxidase FAD binding subunit
MAERRVAETLTNAAAGVVGAEHVRVAATSAEPGAGVAPLVVIEPPDAERAAAVLAWASRDRIPIAIQGGGTKATWGPPLEPVDLLLSTSRLDSVVEHRYGDLTATVQAGATLEGVNRTLNAHNQWIPLDPAWAQRATIGGIVATNDSGPRRHRYGAPRDLIIGVTLARTDGRLAKAGGIVVKNVAGYDLARLVTGSFGTLALIVDATFKLAPVASASCTVIVVAETVAALGNVVADLAAGQTVPSAVELEIPPGRLLIRFQAAEHAARQQASEVATQASEHSTSIELVEGVDEKELWREHERHPWEESGCVVKLSLLPTRIVPIADWLQKMLPETKWELIGRAGLGVLLLRLDANEDDLERYLIELQSQFARGDLFMSVLRASPTLKRRLAAREAQTNALSLMQAIKRQFDPAGILNPGRGPGGV